MTNTPIDWKVFEYKFSQEPTKAFESLANILFCYEMGCPYGVFRYFNQPYIETEPVTAANGSVTGFQAKYYDAGTSLSSKEKDLKVAIEGAKGKYTGINRILFYINKEMSASSHKNTDKPGYQKNIEKCGEALGITIEWRVPGNIEQMLLELPNVRDLYFNPQPGLVRYIELIRSRGNSILANIQSDIPYQGQTIKIRHDTQVLHTFLDSDKDVCVIYGDAGTGKSGVVKDLISERLARDDNTNFFMFDATDLDVEEDALFLRKYGEYQMEDAFSLYGQNELKVCVIESAEKFSTLSNPQVFESLIRKFIEHGWKMIFTIRTAYKNGFCSLLLDGVSYDELRIDRIGEAPLADLGEQYVFHLPEDKKLRDLLCDLFYLKLYLKLTPSSLDTLSSAELFMEQIWKEVICNDNHRVCNLPVRRDQMATNIVFSMLQHETSIYRSGANDDYVALQALEESGVIAVYDDFPGLWMMSHDVYEELIVKHILMNRYQRRIPAEDFLEGFGNSLRARKLYRIWLEALLSQGGKRPADFFISVMQSPLDQAWKDETLIALMQSGNEDAFQILGALMSRGKYELFTQTAFLLNTACRDINKELLQRLPELAGNKYRFTQPIGPAWHAVFKYIFDNRTLILWRVQNLDIVANILKSWVEKYETGETTRFAGKIALHLKHELWCNNKHPYALQRDSRFIMLNDIILGSAMELKEELGEIFNAMISAKTYGSRNEDSLLLKKSLSNIFECGKAYRALPLEMIRLAEGYWCGRRERDCEYYGSFDSMEFDFGLSRDIHSEYKPESAYQTSLYPMLHVKSVETLDLILRLMNYATDCYRKSQLEKEYHEISKIEIKISSEETVRQICSDRLWKMHRGTHVAPELLESALMALEKWLMDMTEQVDAETATLYCKYLLKNSKTAAITSVILSVVMAYPDKLFEISCVLLKTKEIFICDISRWQAERSAGFLKGVLGSHKLYDKERIASNALAFRKTRFEEVLINYQMKPEELPEETYRERLKQLYAAFDEATVAIDSWNTTFQYAYYRIDLRKYQVSASKTTQGGLQVSLETDMPLKLVEISKKSEKEREQLLRHTPLLLWADAKLKYDQKAAQKYPQFEAGPTPVIEEIGQILQEKGEFYFQDIAAAIDACSVLLRDEKASMDEEQITLCIDLVGAACFHLIDQSNSYQSGDGTDAAIPALARLVSYDDFSADWPNPLFLLLALVMNGGTEQETAMESVANILWTSDRKAAWKLIRAYAELMPRYSKEVRRYGGLSARQFFENNSGEIEKIFQEEISDFNAILIDTLEIDHLIDIQRMVNPKDEMVFNTVLKIGNSIWGTILGGCPADEKKRRDYESEYAYMQWLGGYVLDITGEQQSVLLEHLMGKSKYNQEFSHFLREVISAEDREPRYAAFWNFWNLLKNYIFFACEKDKEIYNVSEGELSIGYGLGCVLVDYLLACADWKESAKSWHSICEETTFFYKTVANRIGNHTAVLYAIGRVLNTVGSKVFFNDGVEWLSDIVRNNPLLCEAPLPVNTIYYIEEYMYRYVKKQLYVFRSDAQRKREVLNVLDFLVTRGSTLGFLLREEII